jgi:twitching motility protein PilT
MNGLNSLLKIVVAQQADELRLGVGRAPLVLTRGVPSNLTLAETGDMVLRRMLGSLLSPEAEACLARGASFRGVYEAGDALGTYRVLFEARPSHEPGFDVTFTDARHPAVAGEALADVGGARPEPMKSRGPTPAVRDAERATPLSATPALEALLAQAVALQASDVHVRQGEPAFARVDGRLVPLGTGPRDVHELVGDTLSALGLGSVASNVRSADASLGSPTAGRVRLHVFRVGGRAAIAVRLLPPVVPPLASLGFAVDLADLATLPSGLVLVTGPAGSGKSTTAAALCQEVLRQRSVVLLTLEDPTEYYFDTSGTSSIVRQRQIGTDVIDFSTGLRDALREDPDVLLVGEMRDAESISLALTAAETGHLVIASLHSRSAPSAIDRIIDTYPAARQHQLRIQLSESLRAVIAQRLLPRAHGSGRVAAIEVLRRNSAVANLIREGKTPQLVNVMQSSRKEGMVQLERSLADLCRSGEVEERDARGVANDQDALTEYLHARLRP